MKYLSLWWLFIIVPVHALDKADRTAYKLETADPLMDEAQRNDLCKSTIQEIRQDSFQKADIEVKFGNRIKQPNGYVNNQAFDDYNDLSNVIKYENYIFMMKCLD